MRKLNVIRPTGGTAFRDAVAQRIIRLLKLKAAMAKIGGLQEVSA